LFAILPSEKSAFSAIEAIIVARKDRHQFKDLISRSCTDNSYKAAFEKIFKRSRTFDENPKEPAPPTAPTTPLSTLSFPVLEGQRSADSITIWFAKLFDYCMRSSPSRFIHACQSIALLDQDVAMSLFNISFHSFLPDKIIIRSEPWASLQKTLVSVLLDPLTPPPICCILIDLATFLDKGKCDLGRGLIDKTLYSRHPPLLLASIFKSGRVAKEDLANAYRMCGLLEEVHDCGVAGQRMLSWHIDMSKPSGSAVQELISAVKTGADLHELIGNAYDVIGKENGVRFAGGFTSVLQPLILARYVRELSEIESDNFLRRMKHPTSFFQATVQILSLRIEILKSLGRSTLVEHRLLANLARKAGELSAYESSFQEFQHDLYIRFEMIRESLHNAVSEDKQAAMLARLDNLLAEVQADPDRPAQSKKLEANIVFLSQQTITRQCVGELNVDEASALAQIAENLRLAQVHRPSLALQAWVNMKLFVNHERYDDTSRSARRALEAFASHAELAPESRMADMLQMISLLFQCERVPDFPELAAIVRTVPFGYFIPIFNHVVAREVGLRLRTNVGRFVVELLSDGINEFIDGVLFPCFCAWQIDRIVDQHGMITEPIIHDVIQHSSQTQLFNDVLTMSETLWLDVAPLADFCRSSLMQLKEMSEDILLVTDLQRKFRRDVLPLIDHRINSQMTRRDKEFQNELMRNTLTGEIVCPWMLFIDRMTPLHAMKGWSIFTDDGTRQATQKELQLEIEMIQHTQSFRNPLKFVSDLSPSLNNPAIKRFPMFGIEGVRIEQFCEYVEVLGSGIGRPRKMAVMGSDGKKYTFLVKGHEDLRLDQRVMQFFTLVNTYLTSQIRTYRITPLTGTLGLIQWVDQCPSLRELIRAYDESFGNEGVFHFWKRRPCPPRIPRDCCFLIVYSRRPARLQTPSET
jgi:hypothetical protein